ncbi:MAG: hypothetical protein OXH83_23350 [Bryobacterales bacterium]|nr:hypothetical protein [Bryobacterales bacterium]MDE0624614.1 hypothetical protein [Bryobacterales bacterium]
MLPRFRHADIEEQIAQAFRNRIRTLGVRSLSAYEVFLEYMPFAGGARVSAPRHRVEVRAILSCLLARYELLDDGEESQSGVW